MLRKIALEEHFLAPGLIEYWTPTVAELDRTAADALFHRLTEVGEGRLQEMARAGIERAVLSVAGPGVLAEPVIATAVRKAKEANDFLAREIHRRSRVLLAFAHLPVQDPAAAAAELDRCIHDLEFSGALIHCYRHGRLLDDPAFEPLWECAGVLGVPIYLLGDSQAGWDGPFDVASQVLRLILSGTFDRYPNAQIILGRFGEALPYLLWHFDRQAERDGVRLERRPSDYLRDNVYVTTAGLLATASLYCAVTALGPERVMFATGYPFESSAEAGHFLDTVRLDEGLRAGIAFRNAERLLGL
jgi:2,3-dihydroxybenzoate decarboxylase